jgi:hypothetical protein
MLTTRTKNPYTLFIMRGVIIVIDKNVSLEREKILSERELITIIYNNVEEAEGCTIKYFIVFLLLFLLFLLLFFYFSF